MHWAAWEGDESALRSLVTTIEELVNVDTSQIRERFIASQQERVDQVRETWKDVPSELDARTASAIAETEHELAHFDEAATIRVSTSYKEFDFRRTGAIDDVLVTLNRKGLRSLSLQTPEDFRYIRLPSKVSISFDLIEGVTTEIESFDRDWLLLAESKLKRAIKQNVPWWRFLRTWQFISALAIAAYTLTNIALDAHSSSRDVGWHILVSIEAGLAMFGIGWVIRRVLPAFDLALAGSVGRGSKILRVAASMLFTLGLTIGSTIWAIIASRGGSH